MNYNRLFLLLLALIALSGAAAFWQFFAFPDTAYPLQKGERVVLLPGEMLQQPFVSNRHGLRKIEILFGKFTLSGEAKLVVELRDESCSKTLAEQTFHQQSFDSEYTHAFVFDRQEHSQNQTYCLAVRFISNQPITKAKAPRLFIDEGSQITPYSMANPGGEKSEGAGAIAIRPGYVQESFFSNAKEFFDRISQYKPVFLKSWFLISFAVIGLGLTFCVTALLVREEKE